MSEERLKRVHNTDLGTFKYAITFADRRIDLKPAIELDESKKDKFHIRLDLEGGDKYPTLKCRRCNRFGVLKSHLFGGMCWIYVLYPEVYGLQGPEKPCCHQNEGLHEFIRNWRQPLPQDFLEGYYNYVNNNKSCFAKLRSRYSNYHVLPHH